MTSPTLRLNNKEFFDTIGASCADGSEIRFCATGMSMYPFIVGGRDVVTLTRPDELRKGDIVAAHIPPAGECVLHRIYRVERDRLTLMGDGNLAATETCSPRDVIAKVSVIERRSSVVSTSSRKQRLMAALWMRSLPLRPLLLWLLRKLNFRL